VRRFWPPVEPAQVDYERLRSSVLAGIPLLDGPAARFARAGLAALIERPTAEPVFVAVLSSAARPPWTPYHDPRTAALAAGYGLLLAAADAERAEALEPHAAGDQGS
jgi:hypothetical protein